MSVSIRATTPLPGIRMRGDWISSIGFGLPLTILAGSYLWLAISVGEPALWNAVVHESGRYTLGQTIFYTDHFLREVLIDVVYAAFLAAFYFRATDGRWPGRRSAAASVSGLCLALLMVMAAYLSGAGTHGSESALYDFFQYRTRDDLLEYGSHWRFHWLSTIWFGAAAWIVVQTAGSSGGEAPRRQSWLAWCPWMLVGVATVVFGLDRDVFLDARYLGHQAREILTHGSLTLPLGVAVLWTADKWLGAMPAQHARPERAIDLRFRGNRLALGAAIAIPALVGTGALAGQPMDAGQSDGGLAPMVAGHFFEHVMDYVLVAALAVSIFGSLHFVYRRSGSA